MTEIISLKRGGELLEYPKISASIEGNAFLPQKAFIPVQYADIQKTELLVSKGDYVREGQVIARSSDVYSASVHASIPGRFYDLIKFDLPGGKPLYAAAVQLGGSFDILGKPSEAYPWRDTPPADLLRAIDRSGLLNTGNKKKVSLAADIRAALTRKAGSVCINLFDSDPSCSLDSILFDRFYEKPAEGTAVLAKVLNASSVICIYKAGSVSRERREKIASICSFSEVEFIKVPDMYPVTEHFVSKAIQNSLCIDIPTAIYTYDTVTSNAPVTDVYVLISGKAVNESKVLKAKIGTPVGSLIEECGGFMMKPEYIVINGLMNGFIIDNLDMPVSKFLKSICIFGKETVKPFAIHECINCGLCFNVCPLYLDPKQIVKAVEKNITDGEISKFIQMCRGCGCCSAVCPARIPLSAVITGAKERLAKGSLL